MVDERLLHRVERAVAPASPSIVVTALPCAATASVRQDSVRRPSTWTVHAPHWPWSQPFFDPGQAEMVAQRVEQRRPRVERQPVVAAVDPEHDRHARRRRCRRLRPSSCSRCLRGERHRRRRDVPVVRNVRRDKPSGRRPVPSIASSRGLVTSDPLDREGPTGAGQRGRAVARSVRRGGGPLRIGRRARLVAGGRGRGRMVPSSRDSEDVDEFLVDRMSSRV